MGIFMWGKGEAMTQKERVLELARSQLGVREAPMGTNRVKYNTEYYGWEVKGAAYPWCCVFQWWLFRHTEAGELFYGGGKTASCSTLLHYYQQRGQGVDKKDIRPGDLVFFIFDGGKSGGVNHVGLCESVEKGYVTTIDGNTGADEANGGTVNRRRRSLSYVGGAARPAYRETEDLPPAAGGEEKEERVKLYTSIEEMPAWAKGAAEKALRNGYIRADGGGAVGVWEVSLQPLVWMDRAGLLDKPAQ